MRVLLTGHNGYIGSVMAKVFKQEGHNVVGLDTDYFADCTLFESVEGVAETIRKDIRDITPEDLSGIDAVAHLAALSNDPMGDLDAELTYDINHVASVNLAKMAKGAGVSRFLYSSSCSMYGAGGDDAVNEDAGLHPQTPYAISKVRTEEDLNKLADSDFSPIYMRNATAYGVSPRLRADIVLNNLVCWAITTGEVKIMSDGMAWRPIVHIEDISRIFAAAMVAPRKQIHNQAFNVGVSGDNYRIRELAEIVRETVPGCKIVYSDGRISDTRSYRVDFSKLASTFQSTPFKWNARLGALELFETLNKIGLKLDDFQGRRYIRLNQLRALLGSRVVDANLRWVSTSVDYANSNEEN